jgi:hypothetical protein
VIDRQERFHLLGVAMVVLNCLGREQETFRRIKTVGRFPMEASIVLEYLFHDRWRAVSAEDSAAPGVERALPVFTRPKSPH